MYTFMNSFEETFSLAPWAVRGGGQATRIRKIETSRWGALVWWETQKCFSQRIQTAGGGRGGGGGGGGGRKLKGDA